MKLLLVVLSVLYFAWATPLVTISSTELKEVQEVINAFADLVHTVNFPDMPESLKKQPLTKLTSCISPTQRLLVEVCILDSDQSKPLNDRVPTLIECSFESVGGFDPAKGTINRENVRIGMIEQSLLSTSQKEVAKKLFDDCLNGSFFLPPAFKNHAASGKTMICAVKSLGIAGCGDVPSKPVRSRREFHATA